MSNKKSRRSFIKNTAVGGLAISGLTVDGFGNAPKSWIERKEETPRLPCKIVSTSGISTDQEQKIRSISPEINLLLGLSKEQMQQEISNANAYFGWISEEEMKKASNLKWVQCPSAGVEHLLFPEMMQRPVTLTNAKGCYGPAIGEHVFGLLFGLTRGIGNQVRNMKNGVWKKPENQVEMRGMTMGIIGLGGIGRETARRAKAMDMKVIAADIVSLYSEKFNQVADEVYLMQGGGFEEVLKNSDVIVSAAPHTKESEGIFNKRAFELMKPGSYFINVSRGKLANTPALVEAIETGHLAGAGLDVTDPEPLPSDHALWQFPNVIITSHAAARSQYSWERMQAVFAANVERFVNGYPLLNQVDKELGF